MLLAKLYHEAVGGITEGRRSICSSFDCYNGVGRIFFNPCGDEVNSLVGADRPTEESMVYHSQVRLEHSHLMRIF